MQIIDTNGDVNPEALSFLIERAISRALIAEAKAEKYMTPDAYALASIALSQAALMLIEYQKGK